jgi:hypothetical protein
MVEVAPLATGSAAFAMTIGIVLVARLADAMTPVTEATNTSPRRRTSSPAGASNCRGSTSVQRYSIVMFRPSM